MADDSHGMGIPLPADSTKIHQYPAVTRTGFEKVAEILAGGLTPGILASVADATDAEISSRGLLAAEATPEEVALSITDESLRRSWLEIAKDGGPTAHALAVLAAKLPATAGGQFETFSHETGYVFAIVDEADRIAAGIRADGSMVIHRPERSAFRIVAWGDSLTHADGGTWTTRLASLLGVQVIPRGVSGERAEGIAARQGGIKRVLTVTGGTIPASGGVGVTADGVFLLPNVNSSAGVTRGYLAGIHGTITAGTTNNDWVFTRTTAGTALAVTAAPWISDDSIAYRDALPIFWAGRNSFPFDIDNAPDAAGTALQAMIDYQNNGSKFVALTVLNGAGEGRTGDPAAYAAVTGYAQWMKTHWPHNVLDIRRWLIDHGLAAAGITPTAQDLADIDDDTVPASLRKDWIHLTPTGYALVADHLAAFLTSKEWIS